MLLKLVDPTGTLFTVRCADLQMVDTQIVNNLPCTGIHLSYGESYLTLTPYAEVVSAWEKFLITKKVLA